MPKNNTLFDDDDETTEWRKEWKGMPEFIQEEKGKPYHQLTIRFASKADLEKFAKLIKQKITNKTKAIWYPEIERGLTANKLYVDESEKS